jgi:hypothetical protein
MGLHSQRSHDDSCFLCRGVVDLFLITYRIPKMCSYSFFKVIRASQLYLLCFSSRYLLVSAQSMNGDYSNAIVKARGYQG